MLKIIRSLVTMATKVSNMVKIHKGTMVTEVEAMDVEVEAGADNHSFQLEARR